MTLAVLARLSILVAGLWAGVVACVGFVAAPAAFAVLDRAQAGAYVGRVFSMEAHASLVLAVVVLLLERRLAVHAARVAGTSALSVETVLAMVALFSTVAGYFAVQPMMDAARAGQATWSFATLHAVSLAFFALKGVALLALVWRQSGRISLPAGSS